MKRSLQKPKETNQSVDQERAGKKQRVHEETSKIDSKEDILSDVVTVGEPNASAVNFAVKKEDRMKCPYLDTVNRQLLDFDMEKVCSVTLSNLNVYCCLICGKYFQGRGKSTPAYTHSVASGMPLIRCIAERASILCLHLTSEMIAFFASIVDSEVLRVYYFISLLSVDNLMSLDFDLKWGDKLQSSHLIRCLVHQNTEALRHSRCTNPSNIYCML